MLPLKMKSAICIGEITGDYHFEPKGPDPFFHWREVTWIAKSVPRANFGKDLLFTMRSLLRVCRIQRNDAEARFKVMRANGWQAEPVAKLHAETTTPKDRNRT